MNRLPNLDPLRFFLASLVILFHLPQLSYNQGLPNLLVIPIFDRGTEAVYMFFVLSGFLIIRLIYKEKKRVGFSIRKFYIRRILRILPLYYLVAGFGFLFYNVILPYLSIPFEITYSKSDSLLVLFFLPNVFAKLYQPGGILEILWPIGIEEQFYLIIAPLLYFVSKAKILRLLALACVGYFIAYHLEVFQILLKFHFVYFFLFFGGMVAVLEEKNKLIFLKQTYVIPLVTVIITLLYFFTDLFQFDLLWVYNLVTMVLFGLFIHALACNNFNRYINSEWLNHLGQISYGIYMYRVIAMNFVVFFALKIQSIKIFNDYFLILLIYVFTFILTILLVHISFTYFETFFLKLKNKFR